MLFGAALPASAATVRSVVDIVVTKSAAPAVADIGATVTYTIEVRNLGPSDAPEVVVTDPLPPEVRLVSAASAPPGPSCGPDAADPQLVVCNVGKLLAGGAPAVITVIAEVIAAPPAGRCFTNTATGDGTFTVLLPNGDEATWTEEPATLGDNSASAEVCLPEPPGTLDLAVVIERSGGSRFDVTVANLGSLVAEGVSAVLTVPGDVRVVAFQDAAGRPLECPQRTCRLGTVGPTTPGRFTVELAPTADQTGTTLIEVVAEVAVPLVPGETDVTNNRDTEPVVLVPLLSPAAEARIAGTVFADRDGDGVQDPGEAAIPGVLVAAGPLVSLNTAQGFAFDGAAPDTYALSVDESTLPAGLLASTSPVVLVTLAAGEAVTGIDFGYAPGAVLAVAIEPEILPATGAGVLPAGFAGAALVALGLLVVATARRNRRPQRTTVGTAD